MNKEKTVNSILICVGLLFILCGITRILHQQHKTIIPVEPEINIFDDNLSDDVLKLEVIQDTKVNNHG